jgi:hypothetical protein
MSKHLIHLIFILGLAHIYGCQALTPKKRPISQKQEMPVFESTLKVYKSLKGAPIEAQLFRHKKTGEIYDISQLPTAYRARFSKNPKVFELIDH